MSSYMCIATFKISAKTHSEAAQDTLGGPISSKKGQPGGVRWPRQLEFNVVWILRL